MAAIDALRHFYIRSLAGNKVLRTHDTQYIAPATEHDCAVAEMTLFARVCSSERSKSQAHLLLQLVRNGVYPSTNDGQMAVPVDPGGKPPGPRAARSARGQIKSPFFVVHCTAEDPIQLSSDEYCSCLHPTPCPPAGQVARLQWILHAEDKELLRELGSAF